MAGTVDVFGNRGITAAFCRSEGCTPQQQEGCTPEMRENCVRTFDVETLALLIEEESRNPSVVASVSMRSFTRSRFPHLLG